MSTNGNAADTEQDSPNAYLREMLSFQLVVNTFPEYYALQNPSGTIERFQICGTLGGGAHGTVWRLEEETGGKRLRALKIVQSKGTVTDGEVISLIALNQYENHFIRFFGWWEDENNLYMLTELMAGGDLWKMIGNGPTYLPEAKSQKIAKKILESVAIMHAQGIIHRDLKPGNILLADEDHHRLDIRIADMGISQVAAKSPSRPSWAQGTRGYTAPEVASDTGGLEQNEKRKRFSSDIWSVGCVIFATLAGISPYPMKDSLPKPDGNDDAFPVDLLEYLQVSALGIEFIKGLVQVNWEKRPTATMALEHRWLLTA